MELELKKIGLRYLWPWASYPSLLGRVVGLPNFSLSLSLSISRLPLFLLLISSIIFFFHLHATSPSSLLFILTPTPFFFPSFSSFLHQNFLNFSITHTHSLHHHPLNHPYPIKPFHHYFHKPWATTPVVSYHPKTQPL